jgi:superfamily II DNA or RNA helicase
MINEQKSIIQDEAFEALKENGFNGAAIIATGIGKAKLLVDCIKHLQPKSVLYLCDSEDNRDKTFPDELLKWGTPHIFEIVDRYCYQTAYKFEGREYDLLLADK